MAQFVNNQKFMAIRYLMWQPKFNIGLNLIIKKSMDHMLENKSGEDVYLNIPNDFCENVESCLILEKSDFANVFISI